MPVLKVLCNNSPGKVSRLTVLAGSLKELSDVYNAKTNSSGSYQVYDVSDGALIDDDDCLLGLANFSTTVKNCHLLVRLAPEGASPPPSNQSPPANQSPHSPPIASTSHQQQQVTPRKNQSPPALDERFSHAKFPSVHQCVNDLRDAGLAPAYRRVKAYARARREVVKLVVRKTSKSVVQPGEIMAFCKKLYAAVPTAFEVELKEGLKSSVFPQFVRSVYNAFNYEKSVNSDQPCRKRKRGMADNIPDDPEAEAQVPFLCVDSNGCMEGMWSPIIDDEEIADLELKKSEIQRYSNVPDSSDDHLKKLVRETYPLQRSEINRALTVTRWNSFFAAWQVLRRLELFIIHANLLLGKETLTLWHEEAKSHITIVQFMQGDCEKEVQQPSRSTHRLKIRELLDEMNQAVEASSSNRPHSIAVFSLIALYFKESVNNLHLILDKSMSDEEAIKTGAETSECPLILIKGSSIFDESSSFYVLIRGKFLIKTSTYLDSMLVLALSYFVFNNSYPKSLNKTLEFIQRFFLLINPETQARQEGAKKLRINGEVRKLALALRSYEITKSRWTMAAP